MPIHTPAQANNPAQAIPSSLAGKSIVVTGASSGIGQAMAVEFAKAGANVLVHANTNHKGAEKTAARVRAEGREAHTLFHDLSTTQGQNALVDEAWRWREIDAWVNNAGVDVLTGEAADFSFEEKLALLWEVDVVATLRISREVGKRMLAAQKQALQDKAILNIGWDQAASGMAGDSGEMFAAIKGAVMAFTRSLAKSLSRNALARYQRHGMVVERKGFETDSKSLSPHVRVNCIAPGWIKTEWGENTSEEWNNRAMSESLCARWGLPEDVARVARFLVSEEASFINAQIINVNGGRQTE